MEEQIIDLLIVNYFDEVKINISNNIKIKELKKFELNNFEFYKKIVNYYDKINIVNNKVNMDNLNFYLDSVKTIDFQIIYPLLKISNINLHNEIMYNIFSYTDKTLFNSSFNNFSYYKFLDCNNPEYLTTIRNENNYLKFIFSISSPLYRIYFFFTYLSFISK
jgi:hypothetical protein